MNRHFLRYVSMPIAVLLISLTFSKSSVFHSVFCSLKIIRQLLVGCLVEKFSPRYQNPHYPADLRSQHFILSTTIRIAMNGFAGWPDRSSVLKPGAVACSCRQ